MKQGNRLTLEMAAIISMAIVVIVLGVLQYYWTSQIGREQQQRLRASLETGVGDFSRQFGYDFERLAESFEIDPEMPASTINGRLLRQYSNWHRTTSLPGLVDGIAIWRRDGGREAFLESLDPVRNQFQRATWPAALKPLRSYLDTQFEQLPEVMLGHDATYYPWTFYGGIPALVRPVFKISSEEADSDMKVQPVGFLIIRLNDSFLKQQYLPGLFEHYFGPSAFRIAIRSASVPYRTIYLSDQSFPISTESPDAEFDLFNSVAQEAARRGHPPVEPSDPAEQWQLVAQHPFGSLELAVGWWRQRDLAISLGLLAILMGSIVIVFSVARQAERLAKFQMEFVAGISHELCTPLAVVNSAVENLADGVVDQPAQIGEYAAILRDQGVRLNRLMDQALLLASGKLDRPKSEQQPVEIARIVSQSLGASRPMLRDAGFTVEEEVEADLPLLIADPVAIGKCVDNLISNAMKYSGTERWLALRARRARSGSGDEVQISVEDRGFGIPRADLPSVFEPFYRAQAVRGGQIRGVGLGLYLVKSVMEGAGGRVTVTSELGRGSCFVLHFPVPSSRGSAFKRGFESLSSSFTRFSTAVSGRR